MNKIQGSINIIDAITQVLEESQFMIEENQKRDEEALKEQQHRETDYDEFS